MAKRKMLMVIFTENSSLAASMLCYLAREYGWIVDIFFVSPLQHDVKKVETFLKDYQPDLIGISFKSWERNQAFAFAEMARGIVDAKIIAGGIHPTLMPDEVRDTGFFDAVVVGDGMGILNHILDNYTSFDGGIIQGAQHPDKTFYSKFYFSPSQVDRMKSTETATVLTSIGCPHKCTFCHSGRNNFLPLPVDSIMKNLINLHDSYGVRTFHFLDDLFASNSKRLQRFRMAIEDSGSNIAFSSQVSGKANTFTDTIARELRGMGVETMNFGIETASPKLLKFLRKHQTEEDCYSAVQTCHDHGLNCVVNLMFGIPTQDEDDLRCTLEFVEKAKPDSVNCFFYSPYPGTELYDYCFDNKYFPPSFDRNKFDWFKPDIDGMPEVQIKLNNVDYDLANRYIKNINLVLNREKDVELFKRMEIIDSRPWVLVGTSRHFYFVTLLRKLSLKPWKNCLGYINIDPQAGFITDINDQMPEYSGDTGVRPFWCVTYSFLGSDFKVIERQTKNRFGGEVPLISISSFKKSHTVMDISKILLESTQGATSEA